MSSQGPAGPGQTSVLDQFQRTRRSFTRLFRAHITLLKAEIGEIVGQLKVLATLAAILLGVAFLTGTMLWVGGFLFVGEWLFGSIGWGLAHGALLGVGLIVTLALMVVGARARTSVLSLLISVVIVIVIAVVCGSNVGYNAAADAASNLAEPFGAPGVVALLVGAVVGALLFAILLGRIGGAKGAIGGVILGIVLGGIVGWLIAGAPWTWPPAVGFAITIGLSAWPILNLMISWPGLDPAERFARLYPRQSIEAANETRDWLEEQWHKRQPKLGNR
jgi:hypothetical protein